MSSSEVAQAAAEDHLEGLGREGRRSAGSVYTPRPLASFVLDLALDDRPELIRGTILDPACGAGAFLVTLLHRLAADLGHSGVDLSTLSGHRSLTDAACRQLFGLDLDSRAVVLARQALALEVGRITGRRVLPAVFSENVVVGDFLEGKQHPNPGPPGLIVGNPPYVPIDRLPEEQLVRLRRSFSTASGRLDLYTVFLQQASDVLALGGRWSLITPDKYLTSRSAGPLREYLSAHGSVRCLARFPRHDVFAGAATVPCVTVWERTAGAGAVQLLRCTTSLDGDVDIRSREILARSDFQGRSWELRRPRDRSLATLLQKSHPRLAEVTTRISAGVATGLNGAFLLTADQEHGVEPSLLHRTVGGRDVGELMIADRGQRLLLPYRWDDEGRASLIELRDFPGARRWLLRHRTALEQRHCVRVWGRSWWDLHDPLRDATHLRPKVLVPDLARSNRFAADEQGLVPQHSLYALVPQASTSAVLLAALLNSSAIEYLVRTSAPVVKDGFRRYRRQFLLDLPVPEVAPDVADRIVALAAEGPSPELRDLVDSCFGVDPERVRAALLQTHQESE